MSKKQETIRTTLYLSENVWAALKQAALDGQSSANTIINEEVERYLQGMAPDIQLHVYREGDREKSREPRTVRFRKGVWDELQGHYQAQRFSIAGLVESLLCRRLGIDDSVFNYDEIEPSLDSGQPPEAEQGETGPQPDLDMQIPVGGKTYLVNSNNIIDLNGEPVKPEDKTGKQGNKSRD